MVYTFARVGGRWSRCESRTITRRETLVWLRLHEKGGKHHEMPAHHNLEEYLDAYIEAAGIAEDKKGPLFRTALGETRELTAERDEPVRRLADGPAAGEGTRGSRRRSAATLPGDRDHELPGERRDAGEGPADGRPRVGRRRPSSTTGRDDAITLDEVERIAI